MNKEKISIVIPTYNLKEEVTRCIASVLGSIYPNTEVIVVDNGSSDGTFETLKEKYPKIKLMRSEKNLGVCGGRNLGLRNASRDSQYILFLDHDICLEKDALSRLKEAAEADSRIGIVTGKIFFSDDPSTIQAAGTSINLTTGKNHTNCGKDIGQFDEIKEVQIAPSIILTKRRVFEKIDGFDDLFFANYEDTDFCFRVRDAGFKIFYTPFAKGYHKLTPNARESTQRLLGRSYYIARNRILFMKRHSRRFGIFLLFIPAWCMYYLYLSLRFGGICHFGEYLRGTLDGILTNAKAIKT